MEKFCSKCETTKPVDDFRFKVRAKGYRMAYCIPCEDAYKKEHYRLDAGKWKLKAGKRRRLYLDCNSALLRAYLAEHPCIDCGEGDHVVLEFDHREAAEKEHNIGHMMRSHTWPRILAEIKKCDVRCANCHKRRTAKQLGWYREWK